MTKGKTSYDEKTVTSEGEEPIEIMCRAGRIVLDKQKLPKNLLKTWPKKKWFDAGHPIEIKDDDGNEYKILERFTVKSELDLRIVQAKIKERMDVAHNEFMNNKLNEKHGEDDYE